MKDHIKTSDDRSSEDVAVQELNCTGSNFSPECLYSFTASIELVDQIVYRCADINSLLYETYFYKENHKEDRKGDKVFVNYTESLHECSRDITFKVGSNCDDLINECKCFSERFHDAEEKKNFNAIT